MYKLFFIIGALASMIFHPEAKASVFTPVSLPGLQSRVTSQLLTRLLPHTSLPEAKASVFTRFTPGASVPGYATTSDKAFTPYILSRG